MTKTKNLKYLIVALCCLLMACLVILSTLMDKQQISSSHKPSSDQAGQTAFQFDPETLTYDGNGKLDLLQGVTFADQDAHEIADQLTINVKTGDSLTDKIITYKTKTEQGTDTATRPLVLQNYHAPSITLPELPNVTDETKNNMLDELLYTEGFATDDGFGNDMTSNMTVTYEKDKLNSSLLDYTFTFVNSCGDEATATAKAQLEGVDAIIVLKQSSVSVKKNAAFNPNDYLESCTNAWYEDISDLLEITNSVDTSEPGTYTVKYSVYGEEMTLTVKVTD